jgi:hypothetical protein
MSSEIGSGRSRDGTCRVDDAFDLVIAHYVDRSHLNMRIIARVEEKQEFLALPGRLLRANDQS